jgi:RNA polymerase sigma-70 factor (ECF subfamily)
MFLAPAPAMAVGVGHREPLAVPTRLTDAKQMTSPSAGITERDTSPSAEPPGPPQFLDCVGPELDRSYRLAGLILGNVQEAEDAVQDAVVVAWKGFDRLRNADRFGAWFDRIVVNGCRDRMRRRGTVRFIAIDQSIDPVGPDPFRDLIERDALLNGLTTLKPDERTVVVLRFWGDLPLDEIAERLGWPLGSVKSRLHRALARLRQGLAGESTDAAKAPFVSSQGQCSPTPASVRRINELGEPFAGATRLDERLRMQTGRRRW